MESDSVGSSGSDLYHDTGFGLNLAYWIVRCSGGNLEFETDDTTGTTVTIRLPKSHGQSR